MIVHAAAARVRASDLSVSVGAAPEPEAWDALFAASATPDARVEAPSSEPIDPERVYQRALEALDQARAAEAIGSKYFDTSETIHWAGGL